MKVLNLTHGLTDNEQYKAFKFPGGEIHLKFKMDYLFNDGDITIQTRLNSSDDLILLILAIETIAKDWPNRKITVFIPYMPYQQADRDFSVGECFSLKTITTILNSLPVEQYVVYDAHSDVTPALLKKCKVIDNSTYIKHVVSTLPENVILLSPDAGAYKKIYKLAEKINFKGEVASANKSRSISTGNIDSIELSKQDFEGKPVLIVDDICIGGRTFVELAKKLKERNVGSLYLAVSHGIFSNGLNELSQYFDGIFTTNSRRSHYLDQIATIEDEKNNLITAYDIFI
jgi:ribose-phosphate pyrophosphokinase